MEWIFKGRTVASADGRWRIAKVFRTWALYDRGVCISWDCISAEDAIQRATRVEALPKVEAAAS